MLKMPTVEKTNGTNNRYCEDWLPVKNITNGMIQLENGYFVCGIKVEPKNIFILDEGARNNVIVQLRNFYNTIDFEFWMIIADNAFMGAEYNVVDTEYFFLFKEKRMDLIQKKLRTLMSGLANCGLNSIQVSNSDLRMVLDNFLNGGTQTNFGTVMF